MECGTKDGLLIFLLVVCGILVAFLVVVIILACRRRGRCGGKVEKTQAVKAGKIEAEEVNISRVGNYLQPDGNSVYEERYVGDPSDRDDLRSGQIQRAEKVTDLRELPKFDDDHIYESAREDGGSMTDYASVISGGGSHRPSMVSIQNEMGDRQSVSSKASKMSSSSSSSSAPSENNLEISEVHDAVVIQKIHDPEPIYTNVIKEHITVVQTTARRTMSSESSSTSSDSDIEANNVITPTKYAAPNPPRPASPPSSSDSEVEVLPTPTRIPVARASRPPSSSSSSDDESMIEVEHSVVGRQSLSAQTSVDPAIEQAIEDIIQQHMPVIEDYTLGHPHEVDWTREVDRMEEEINILFLISPPTMFSNEDNFYQTLEDRPVSVMNNHHHYAEQDRRSPSLHSSSSSSRPESIVEINLGSAEEAEQMRAVSSRQSFQDYVMDSPDFSSTKLVSAVQLPDLPVLIEPPLEEAQIGFRSRTSSEGSSISTDSSSSSNSPSKTIAESDLSIPLSQQVFAELDGNSDKHVVHNYANISGDLRGHNNNIYQIQEEVSEEAHKIEIKSASTSQFSSDNEHENFEQEVVFNGVSPVIKKATKISYHSSDDNSPLVVRKAKKVSYHSSEDEESIIIKPMQKRVSTSEDTLTEGDDDAFEDDLEITEMMEKDEEEETNIKPMRRSVTLAVPSRSRMERISEGSNENGISPTDVPKGVRFGIPGQEIDTDEDRNVGRTKIRKMVRRNSSGISSSSSIHRLVSQSEGYQSVYRDEEEQRRNTRAATAYSNKESSGVTLFVEEESAA